MIVMPKTNQKPKVVNEGRDRKTLAIFNNAKDPKQLMDRKTNERD